VKPPNSIIVAKLINELIPVDICSRYKLIPLTMNKSNDSVLVGMVDPHNLNALDDLKRILKHVSFKRILITDVDFKSLITTYRDDQLKEQVEVDYHKSVDISNLLEDNVELKEEVPSIEELGKITRFVNVIISRAIQEGASDIHFEPLETVFRIRFRKDGILSLAYPEDTLPKNYASSVATRIKILADLNISEKRLPQDGKFRQNFMSRKIDFRVSTIPSIFGETVVIRILDKNETDISLDNLISCPNTVFKIKELTNNPFGLFLVTGPTGSGKTTTLYSILIERNTEEISIVSAEDPIEYILPGSTQVQLLREKGMNFSAILRSFLRQDPDIIFVGETRDLETAKTAIEAALTGHLVLSTLHTNNSASSVSRLTEMGIEPFTLAGTLVGVLAQRLARKVCEDCRIPYYPTQEELHYFGMPYEKMIIYKSYKPTSDEILKHKFCKNCQGLGYKGRVGMYELFVVSSTIKTLICEGASTSVLEETAIKEGMTTLLTYSLNLVKQGVTTLEEVKRVTLIK